MSEIIEIVPEWLGFLVIRGGADDLASLSRTVPGVVGVRMTAPCSRLELLTTHPQDRVPRLVYAATDRKVLLDPLD